MESKNQSINQFIYQPINYQIDQSNNQSIIRSINNQLMKQFINEPINQLTSQSINLSTIEYINQLFNKSTNQ